MLQVSCWGLGRCSDSSTYVNSIMYSPRLLPSVQYYHEHYYHDNNNNDQ